MRINYIIVIVLGLWLFAGRRARARVLLKHVRAFPYESFCAATGSSDLFLQKKASSHSFLFSCLSCLLTRTVNNSTSCYIYTLCLFLFSFPKHTPRSHDEICTRATLHFTSPSHRIGVLAHEHNWHTDIIERAWRSPDIRMSCVLVSQKTIRVQHGNGW